MLNKYFVSLATAVVLCVAAGCAGPQEKLGRGLTNLGEITRGGELSRSFEQYSVFGSTPDHAYTTGIIRGLNKSVVRTFAGAYEVLTFPIPNHAHGDYGAVLLPSDPVYPASYKPNRLSDTTLSPDNNLGFSGGDIAPMIPGSRFHVFDN
jgi:putative exosortase-associated protein (TIGR04073 family)